MDIALLAEHDNLNDIFARAVRVQSDAELPEGIEGLVQDLRMAVYDIDQDIELTNTECVRLLERGAGYVRRDLEATYQDLEDHERLIAKLNGHVSEVRGSRDVTFNNYDELTKKTGLKEHEQ